MKKSATMLVSAIGLASIPINQSCDSSKEKEAELPNLVVIMVDQMRATTIEYLGQEPVKTPNLDNMISESVFCRNATSAYPISSPARAIFLTGKYSPTTGVIGNCSTKTIPSGMELKTDENCWSDILKSKGYSLGYLGKLHLDSPKEPYVPCYNNRIFSDGHHWNEWCPPERRHGFDYWIAYGTYDDHLRPMYWNTDASRDEYYFVDQWGPEYEADRAIDYITNKGGKLRGRKAPFALMVSMNPPHPTYKQVPEKYLSMYDDLDMDALVAKFPNVPPAGTRSGDLFRDSSKYYYAAITGVDEQVGRIINCINKQGLDKNTIVVFMADHGNCLGMNDHSQKEIIQEPSFRIPLIIRYKDVLTPSDDSLLIDVADIYPSIFGLMGHPEWIDEGAEGEDLSDCLRGSKEGRPTAKPYLNCIRFPGEKIQKRGIRTDRFSYVLYFDDATKKVVGGMFFDRKKDPFQLDDEYETMDPALKAELDIKFRSVFEKIYDPLLEDYLSDKE